jgi:hypothetical protein
MKKFALLLLAILPFISCEDTETNEVALQAKINNRLYQSTDVQGSTSEGGLKIQGSNLEESLTLNLSSLREGEFVINGRSSNSAVFSDVFGNVFNTNPGGEGLITISELDEINKTVTGSFNFSAVMPGVDTIYVSRGVLYRVPFGELDLPDPDPETGDDAFRAKIDGNPFNASLIVTNSGAGTIVLHGSTGNSSIVITMPETAEPGTYDVEWDYSAVLMGPEYTDEETTTGKISIQAHDPDARTIIGTFWFNTTNHAITDGVFDLTYDGL